MQVLSLEASLSAVHSERSQSDMGLKSRMQELLSELQSTLQVRLLNHCCHADVGVHIRKVAVSAVEVSSDALVRLLLLRRQSGASLMHMHTSSTFLPISCY